MIACSQCTAKFASSPEIEAAWEQMHAERFHRQTRATGRVLAFRRPLRRGFGRAWPNGPSTLTPA